MNVSETAWSGSNGGFSSAFKKPSYQNGFHSQTYRGVPDLSANADPQSGYSLCIPTYNCSKIAGTYDFQTFVGDDLN